MSDQLLIRHNATYSAYYSSSSARLWNARTYVYKYYTSGNIQTSWRLSAFSALSSSLCKAFRNAKDNRRGGTSSRWLPCRFITAALSDQSL